MAEPKNDHITALKVELNSLPENDTQERASLERRIKAVYTATVGGKDYSVGGSGKPMMEQVYTDFVLEHARQTEGMKKYTHVDRDGTTTYSDVGKDFVPSEKLQQLSDIAQQYDPYGRGRNEFIFMNMDQGYRATDEKREIRSNLKAAMDDLTEIQENNDFIKEIRQKYPDKKTVELLRGNNPEEIGYGADGEGRLYGKSLEDKEIGDKIDQKLDAYYEKMADFAIKGDILIEVTGGKVEHWGKMGTNDVRTEYEPVFSVKRGNTNSAQTALDALSAMEKDIRLLAGSERTREQVEEKLEFAPERAATLRLRHLMKEGIITREESRSISNEWYEKAKDFVEKDNKTSMNEPAQETDREKMVRLAEEFKADSVPAGSTVPRAREKEAGYIQVS